MAKEFDREARKERQDAGEHRADAVGLLTPALLRKHIKSGTDLVLAYGKKRGDGFLHRRRPQAVR